MPDRGWQRAAALSLPAWVGGAALLVSLIGISGPSLWLDEAATISAVDRPLADLWAMSAHTDLVHTCYYTLLHGWTRLWGTSELALRVPSALAFAGGCALVSRIAGELGGRRAAWVAGVLAVILPGWSWVALDARPAAFAALWVVGSTLALLRARRSSGSGWWVAYAVLVLLALLTQVLTILVLPAHALMVAPRLRAWCVSALVPVLALTPFLLAVREQSDQVSWIRVELPGALLAAVFGQFGAGPISGTSSWLLTGVAASGVVVAAVLLALGPVVLGVGAGPRGGAAGPESGAAAVGRGVRAGLCWWLLAPGVLALAASLVATPIYTERYFAWSVPALAILAGVGAARLRPRLVWVAVLAAVALAVPIGWAQRGPSSSWGDDYRALGAAAARVDRDGTVVAFWPASARSVAVAYPRDFAGLADVSLAEAPVASQTLFGRNVDSAELLARVRQRAPRRVVVVYRDPRAELGWDSQPLAVGLRELGCQRFAGVTARRNSLVQFDCR